MKIELNGVTYEAETAQDDIDYHFFGGDVEKEMIRHIHGYGREKAPHEHIISTSGSRRAIDMRALIQKAIREDWSTDNATHIRKVANVPRRGFSEPHDDYCKRVAAAMAARTARAKATMAAWQALDRYIGWLNDDWCYMVVRVTALNGPVEGEFESVGGVESDGDYWEEIARELAGYLDRALQKTLKLRAESDSVTDALLQSSTI